MTDSRKSQAAKILRLLIDAGDKWTPTPKLAGIALQYSRAVHSLRKLGFVIENRVEHHDGVTHGFFRLIKGPPLKAAPRSQPQPSDDRLVPAPLNYPD